MILPKHSTEQNTAIEASNLEQHICDKKLENSLITLKKQLLFLNIDGWGTWTKATNELPPQ